MKKVVLFLIVGFLLSGCATEGKFREQVASNLGANIDDVIERIGAPTNITELHDGKLYTWHESNGSRAVASYGVVSAYEVFCDIRFTVDATGTITKYSYYGNSCRSK